MQVWVQEGDRGSKFRCRCKKSELEKGTKEVIKLLLWKEKRSKGVTKTSL